MTTAYAFGQEPAQTAGTEESSVATPSEPDATASDPDNKHLQVVRFQVAAHEVIALQAVEHESLMVCVEISSGLQRITLRNIVTSAGLYGGAVALPIRCGIRTRHRQNFCASS
jgi:hypothetical protein